MITDYSRKLWIGASDSLKVITPNHSTQSWREWWHEKLGLCERDFQGNIYTHAGTIYEHPILESWDKNINKDRQLIIEDLRLRINYDGDLDGNIFEVKTHKAEKPFEISKYIQAQVQTQMYVWKEKAKLGEVPNFNNLYILSYGLYEDEYDVEEPQIDFNRIKVHKVKYNKAEVKHFLKCLKPLAEEIKEHINAKEVT